MCQLRFIYISLTERRDFLLLFFADTILKYIMTPHADHAAFMAVMLSGR